MNILFGNPEFRRHMWLEFTPHRLIAAPAVIALILYLVAAGASDNKAGAVALAALTMYGVLVPLWGARLTADSIGDELRDHTWDTQRMSALTPFELTLGKLLGASVFAWYAGLICLAAFSLAASFARDLPLPIWKMLALALGIALLVHATVLFATLVAVRAQSAARSSRSSSGMMVLLLFLFTIAIPWAFESLSRDDLHWYGLRTSWADLWIASCWAFAIWAAIGAWRLMSIELQLRTVPSAWVGFAAFLALYLSGFVLPPAQADLMIGLRRALSVAFLVSFAMTYLAVWWEPVDRLSVRRLLASRHSADRRRLLEALPCWSATLVPAALIALALLSSGPGHLGDPASSLLDLGAVAAALLLLMLRDVAVIHLCAFARDPRRAKTVAFFYLTLAYLVVPWLLHLAELKRVAELVLPPVFTSPYLALGIAAAQTVVVGIFMLRRWQDAAART